MPNQGTVAAGALVIAAAGSAIGLQSLPARTSEAAASRPIGAKLSKAALIQTAAPANVPSNPDRDAFFGQTHNHTSWSPDAYVIGNTVTGPAEAYQFAMGMPIMHPGGYQVKLKRPLDFQGVTDHAEYVGMLRLANDPSSAISKLPVAAKLKASTPEQVQDVFKFLAGSIARNQPIKELLDPKLVASVWQQNIEIADKYNQPGKFTAFVAYEWTSMPGAQNLHRNIFFRDSKHVPTVPFSAIDSVHPEDLWAWMDVQRKAGTNFSRFRTTRT